MQDKQTPSLLYLCIIAPASQIYSNWDGINNIFPPGENLHTTVADSAGKRKKQIPSNENLNFWMAFL